MGARLAFIASVLLLQTIHAITFEKSEALVNWLVGSEQASISLSPFAYPCCSICRASANDVTSGRFRLRIENNDIEAFADVDLPQNQTVLLVPHNACISHSTLLEQELIGGIIAVFDGCSQDVNFRDDCSMISDSIRAEWRADTSHILPLILGVHYEKYISGARSRWADYLGVLDEMVANVPLSFDVESPEYTVLANTPSYATIFNAGNAELDRRVSVLYEVIQVVSQSYYASGDVAESVKEELRWAAIAVIGNAISATGVESVMVPLVDMLPTNGAAALTLTQIIKESQPNVLVRDGIELHTSSNVKAGQTLYVPSSGLVVPDAATVYVVTGRLPAIEHVSITLKLAFSSKSIPAAPEVVSRLLQQIGVNVDANGDVTLDGVVSFKTPVADKLLQSLRLVHLNDAELAAFIKANRTLATPVTLASELRALNWMIDSLEKFGQTAKQEIRDLQLTAASHPRIQRGLDVLERMHDVSKEGIKAAITQWISLLGQRVNGYNVTWK